MAKNLSPLRYPGGKNKLFDYTKNLIESNNLKGCTYIEPFAGGCGLSLSLLANNVVNKLVLNDLDISIYSLWESILKNSKDLCTLIYNTPVTIEEWKKQKYIQDNKKNFNSLELGFSTLFLNRTNRSGILKAGPIGGHNQEGNYKIDCRFNKLAIIEKIKIINSFKENIFFYNYDAKHFLNKVVSRQKKDTFIFFDPPYYEKGPELYMNHLNHFDHINLAKTILKSKKKNWIITYDTNEIIKEIYSEQNYSNYNLRHTANINKLGSEIMIYSDNIVPISFNI